MAIDFPTDLDSFDNRSLGQIIGADHVNDLQDAVEALEAKVGVDDSTVKTSIDYLVRTHHVNAIINGIGEINQRVTAFTLVKDEYSFDNPGHGPDRHEGMATGTNVTAGTFGVVTNSAVGVTGKTFKFAGVTLTGTGILYHRYRMEAADAVKFKNQVASFSCRVLHDVGSAKDFTIFIRKADAADNFSAVTAIDDSGAQSIETATNSDLNFLEISMGDCSNGIEIEIKIETGAITTKNVELAELQFELGAINTDFEYRNVGHELALCQRYYCKSYNQSVAPGTDTDVGLLWQSTTLLDSTDSILTASLEFPVIMRTAPTIATWDKSENLGRVFCNDVDNITPDISNYGETSVRLVAVRGVVTTTKNLIFHFTAEAEL